MPDAPPKPRQAPMLEAFTRLLDAVQHLVREHLALARVELKHELNTFARNLSLAVVGVPLLLAGWILLMVALALGLPLPGWASFGLVALGNLAAGAALTRVALRRVSDGSLGLPRTGEELRRDGDLVAALASGRPAAAARTGEQALAAVARTAAQP